MGVSQPIGGVGGAGAEAACAICDFVASTPPVFEDADWVAGVLPGLEVPGWVVLALRRHALEATGMTPSEAAGFGGVVRALTAAIKAATGAERVYLQAFGENFAHWHAVLAAREAVIPAEHRHAAFYLHRDEYLDAPRAADVAGRIRLSLTAPTVS